MFFLTNICVQLENTLKIATTNKLIDAIGLELGQILCTYVAPLGICSVQELWTMVLWCNFGQKKNESLLFAIFFTWVVWDMKKGTFSVSVAL